MFAVKVSSDNIRKNTKLNLTINNILTFLKSSLKRKVNIISDSNSMEIISGNINTNNGEIVTELTFKKVIKINLEDIEDKQNLDKYIKEVKHFCEQVSQIEDLKYLPINYRSIDNDK